jgi:hypothetical protein
VLAPALAASAELVAELPAPLERAGRGGWNIGGLGLA